MRALTTILYGVAATLILVTVAASLIGAAAPDNGRQGGLTAATVLGTDGPRANDAEASSSGSPSS